MYGTMAGVSAAEPGYRKSLIAPTPGPGLTFADFRHTTRYGAVASRWERVGAERLKLDVTVPGNTTATVRIPAPAIALVTESGQPLSAADHVTDVTDTGDTVTVTVGSGRYSFVVAPSPVELRSTAVQPVSGEPGTGATVQAVVRNRSAAAVTGRLGVTVPAGWEAPAPSQPVTIAAGAEVTLSVPVKVPLVGNAGPVTLRPGFSDARGDLVTGRTAFTVTQSLTPANPIDAVDLGDGPSETRHALTAAASSGTGVEAGRTRRYSGIFVPGSWFAFDLGIRTGQPFLMRVVETYDGPQVKDYEIRINDKLVHHRVISRSSGGLETYQLKVDDPALLTGSTVRVRIQHNATASGHDPSLADVWSLPLP